MPAEKMGRLKDLTDALARLDGLITAHAKTADLKAQLVWVRELAEALECDLVEAEGKLANCERQLAEADASLSADTGLKEFVECRGAFFKRKPGGGYDETVYCPRCRHPMASSHGRFSYFCEPCNQRMDFSLRDLKKVMSELPP